MTEGKGLDPIILHLSEEGKDVVVFDPPGFHRNLQCAIDGRIAMMSRNFIHIYSPKLKLADVYNASWIQLQPKVLPSNFCLDRALPFNEQVRATPNNETRIVFKKMQWIPSIRKDLDPVVLLCSLNDGSLLAFKRHLNNTEQDKIELSNSTNDQIVMKDYVCIYEHDKDCPDPILTKSHRIDTFEVIDRMNEENRVFLVTVCGIEVVIWEVEAQSATSNKMMLRMIRKFSFGDHLEQTYILAMSPLITCLGIMLPSDDSRSCHVVCGFRHGTIGLLHGDWSIPHQFSLNNIDQKEFRYKVIDNMVVTSNTILLCSHNNVIAMNIENSKLNSLWQAALHDSPITSLLAKYCRQTNSLILTSSSLSGEIKYWKAQHQSLMPIDSMSIEQAQHGIYGLSEDPIGCLTFYSYCSPRVLENTREVQLNYALGTEQTKFSFLPNRHLQREWIVSPTSVAAFLLRAMQDMMLNTMKPVTFLGLAVVDTMELLKRNFRKLPIKPLPPAIREVQIALENGEEIQSKKKRKSTGAGNDESSEEEYLSDDNEATPQKSSGKNGGDEKGKSGGSNDGGGGAGMNMLVERLRDYLDPDPLTLTIIGIDFMLDGFMISSSCLMHAETLTSMELTDRLVFIKDNSTKEDLKKEFMQIESDLNQLQKKYYLWQMCHHVLCSMSSMRLSCLAADHPDRHRLEQFTNDLRSIMSQARVILACIRMLHHSQSSGISKGVDTIHRLLRVLPSITSIDGLKQSLLQQLPTPTSDPAELCPVCSNGLGNCNSCSSSPECQSCQIEIDRCSFSFELLPFGVNTCKIYSCTICKAAANGQWMLENAELCRILYCVSHPICPFCGIFMHQLV